MSLEVLAAVHAVATIAMAGLVWFVQIVHYPLFERVSDGDFPAYHEGHTTRTGRVVVPLMLVELGSAMGLGLVAPPHVRGLAVWGLALLALIWLSTFVVQVPLHRGLAAAPASRERRVRRLVRANWLRTVAWSARAVLSVALVLRLGAL